MIIAFYLVAAAIMPVAKIQLCPLWSNSGQALHRSEMTIGRPPPCDDGMRSIAPSWF